MQRRTSVLGVAVAMTNEEFVERIRGGDANSIEELLRCNREYLYKLARRLSNNPDVIEDLVQEGSIAILDAAGSYEPGRGTLFLTYATPMIKKSMRSFMAKMSLPMEMPVARYSRLRKVNFLVIEFQIKSENRSLHDLLLMICQELNVSEKVACGLLQDFSTIFQEATLDEHWEQSVPCLEADPAKVYEQELLSECIGEAMGQLSPRERNLIQYHLGLNDPDGLGITFQELAVLLNFNGHSAAEKAYKRAVESLKNVLYAGRYSEYVRTKQIVAMAQRML